MLGVMEKCGGVVVVWLIDGGPGCLLFVCVGWRFLVPKKINQIFVSTVSQVVHINKGRRFPDAGWVLPLMQ